VSSPKLATVMVACVLALGVCGCGGAASGPMGGNPISVSLENSTVTVKQGGAPVIVLIQIMSPSETALVSLTGLPGGVGESYAASDTNPSGTLTFKAGKSATLGTFTPKITVMSAGQTAMTTFTLVVEKGSS